MTTYTPTAWVNGDLITDAKLNKIEDRIEELQTERNIFVLADPIQDNYGFFYFPNALTWNEIIATQDHGNNIVFYDPSNGIKFETRLLLRRNAYPSAFLTNSDYTGLDAASVNSTANIYYQDAPSWYFSTQIYIIVGVMLVLTEGKWVPRGRRQLFYKTATSRELYAAGSEFINHYIYLNMPTNNGGTGDITNPTSGSCGCEGEGGSGEHGIADEGDYGCESNGTRIIGADSGDSCAEKKSSSSLTKGASSNYSGGDYCSGGASGNVRSGSDEGDIANGGCNGGSEPLTKSGDETISM